MKSISIILILSFLFYCFGCYNTKVVKNENEFQDANEVDGEIYVKTRKGITYFYDKNMYKFGNDTLYGEGQMITERGWRNDPESIKISYIDIKQIKIKEIDPTRTIVGVVITGGIVIGLTVFIITMSDLRHLDFNRQR